MSFSFVNGVLNISFDLIGTVTIALLFLLLGYWIKTKIFALQKFCIPAPVVGGFIFVFIHFFIYLSGSAVFKFNATLQSVFMLAFFTSVGLSTSLKILVTGGKLLALYWVVNVFVTILQTGIGVFIGPAVGLGPLYGIMSGPVALVGGHGGAAAYGSTLEGMGYPGASLVGLTAATFGLVVASLVGGPLSRRLIEVYHLKPEEDENFSIDTSAYDSSKSQVELTMFNVMSNIAALFVCMSLGSLITLWIGSLINMAIPTYVGAMFFAVLIRNLNDNLKIYPFSLKLNENLGDVCLGIYLSMALITLKLWELAGLAGPLLITLIIQCIVLLILTYFVIFRILGKNYDAAVMCGGLIGHDIGSTPTAIANMTTVFERYGMSKKAIIIVPIVGAFLIDVFYQPFTIYCINYFANR